ncbi:MAG: hypothetical protein MJ072_00055 [Clostridia bacterium]|nr:hypothetical protein [Clostridia bacterium]
MKQTKNFEDFFDGLRDICDTFGRDLVRIAKEQKTPREEFAAVVYKRLLTATPEEFAAVYGVAINCSECPAFSTCEHSRDCFACVDVIEKLVKDGDEAEKCL